MNLEKQLPTKVTNKHENIQYDSKICTHHLKDE